MKLTDLLTVIEGTIIHECDVSMCYVHDIQIDSRMIEKGDIFIAVKGKHGNGHDYIEDAINRGAKLVIVEQYIEIASHQIILVRVPSTIQVLGVIANFFRNFYHPTVIAITGSNGKTTTKELIASILSSQYEVLKSEGNYNNYLGLPLTLFRLKPHHQVCVVELGMNHQHEIDALSLICEPDISIITNIGSAHIGNLKSKKNIFKAKMEITMGMNGGTLLLNGDDSYLKKIKSNNKYKVQKVGSKRSHDVRYADLISDLSSSTFDVIIEQQPIPFFFQNPGSYFVYDVLLAIGVGRMMNIPVDEIQKQVASYKSSNKRMDLSMIGSTTIINDCYNASYESLLNILSVLKVDRRPKLLILGDMLELGKYERRIHQKVGRYLKNMKDTTVLLVGPLTLEIQRQNPRYSIHFPDNKTLYQYFNKLNLEDHIILLKGSRRMHLEEIYDSYMKDHS